MLLPNPVFISSFVFLAAICLLPPKLAAQNDRCAAGKNRQFTSAYLQQIEVREHLLSDWMKSHEGSQTERAVVTIPVVVHVIWNKNEENIPNEQILSQIDVLNEDFRAGNVEIPGIPTVFQDKIADVEIEFCLASKDPNGNATTGVTRTYTDNTAGIGGTTNIHYTNLGGKDAWNPEEYLNIWVAKFAGGVGGVSSFPGEGPLAEDGIQIDYRQFGTINAGPPYHLGRTCTHEIGHYFNLEHVWGPSINSCCDADDFVADTPNACETYLSQCPTHPVISCTQPDMFMNYLFYTDDDCMGMFTNGQKARMLATLNTMRTGLLTSDACGLVAATEPAMSFRLKIFQNPANETLGFEVQCDQAGQWQATLADFTGKKLVSKKIPANLRQTFELGNLPAGVYFLMCENGEKRLGEKVLILR